MLASYDKADCSLVVTPIVLNAQVCVSDEIHAVDRTEYQKLIGSLSYLSTHTLLDITCAFWNLCSYYYAPKKVQCSASKRVLCYLKGTANIGLMMLKESDGLVLLGLCDSDWGVEINAQRPWLILRLGSTTEPINSWGTESVIKQPHTQTVYDPFSFY